MPGVTQVERLQRKFATIHSTLAQQQTQKPAEPPLPSPLRSSVPSSINVAESFPKARSTVGACHWLLCHSMSSYCVGHRHSKSKLHTACTGLWSFLGVHDRKHWSGLDLLVLLE